jgi:glycosyltransferase involved in cell wall biosynthesis
MDVLLVPSWREPFGMVVLEGMATEVPVIGASSGGIPEIIRHDVDGLLVPPRDVAALVAATNRLLDSPEERQRLGRAGRLRVLDQFAVSMTASQVIALYESVRRS